MRPIHEIDKKYLEMLRQILTLYQEFDGLARQEGSESSNFQPFGRFFESTNKSFYEGGAEIGAGGNADFATLASIPNTRKELAEVVLSMMFFSWKESDKKDEFKVVEYGAGSGELLKEILEIRKEKILQTEKASDANRKEAEAFLKSLRFHVADTEAMIQKQKDHLGEELAKEVIFDQQDLSDLGRELKSYDFGYGNEIFDTQRVDYLAIRKNPHTSKKEHLLRFVGKDNEENFRIYQKKLDERLVAKIGEAIGESLEGKAEGLYMLPLGHLAMSCAMHMECKSFFHSDYFLIEQNASAAGIIKIINNQLGSCYFEKEVRKLSKSSTNRDTKADPTKIVVQAISITKGASVDLTTAPPITGKYLATFDLELGTFGNRGIFASTDPKKVFLFKNALSKKIANFIRDPIPEGLEFLSGVKSGFCIILPSDQDLPKTLCVRVETDPKLVMAEINRDGMLPSAEIKESQVRLLSEKQISDVR